MRDNIAVRNSWRALLSHSLCPDGKTAANYPIPGDEVPVLYYKAPYTRKDIIAKLEAKPGQFPVHMIEIRHCWYLGKVCGQLGINMRTWTFISGNWLCGIKPINQKGFNANRPKKSKLPALIRAGKALAPRHWKDTGERTSGSSSNSSESSEEEEADSETEEPPKKKVKVQPDEAASPSTSASTSATASSSVPVSAEPTGESSKLEPIFYPCSDNTIKSNLHLELLEWIKVPSSTKLSIEDRKKAAKATMFDWFYIFDTILDKGEDETHKIYMSHVVYFLGRCHDAAPELELRIMVEIANYGNHPQWEDSNKTLFYMVTNDIFKKIYDEGIEYKCIDESRWELAPTCERAVVNSTDITALFTQAEEYFNQYPGLKEKLKIMMAPTSSYMPEMLTLCQNKEVVLAYGNFDAEHLENMTYFCLDCLRSYEYSPYLPKNQILVPTADCEHKVYLLLVNDYVKELRILLGLDLKVAAFSKEGKVLSVVPEWRDEEGTQFLVQLMMSAHKDGWFKNKKITYDNLIQCPELMAVKCPFCDQQSAQKLTHHARLCPGARQLAREKQKMVADLHARLYGATEPTVRLFFVENPKLVISQGLELVSEDDHDEILIDALSFKVDKKTKKIVPTTNMFDMDEFFDKVEKDFPMPKSKPLSPLPSPSSDAQLMPPPLPPLPAEIPLPPPPPPPATTTVTATVTSVSVSDSTK